MRRGPEDARRVHHVAIGLDGDREAPVLLVGERGADRGRRAVADAAAARVTEPLIPLVEIPEPPRPVRLVVAVIARDERPVVVPDLRPHFGAESRNAHRARIPGIGRADAIGLRRRAAGLCQLRPAFLEHPLAVGGEQAPDGVDQRWECRLAVGGNRQVNVLQPAEVLVVGADVQVARADRDQPGVRLRDTPAWNDAADRGRR